MHLGIPGEDSSNVKISILIYPEFTEFLVRAGIDSVSINPDAAVFTRKLVASIEQRIMLEKALGQVKTDPDRDLPDPGEE